MTSRVLRSVSSHSVNCVAVAQLGDCLIIASGTESGTVDIRKADQLWVVLDHPCGNPVRAVTISPNCEIVASAIASSVCFWQISTGTMQFHYKDCYMTFGIIAFSPDGKTFAAAMNNAYVRLWNVDRIALQYRDTIDIRSSGRFTCAAFSPNGKILAFGSADKSVSTWCLETNKLQHILRGHRKTVKSVTFDPSGKTLVSGAVDCTVRLWNTKTGQLLRVLQETCSVACLAFNGRMLVCSVEGSTGMNVWSLAWPNKAVRCLLGHDSYVSSAVFAKDGKTLVSGAADFTTRVWNVFDCNEAMRRAALYLHVATAPYVALEIGNFLLAKEYRNCFAAEEGLLHATKIQFLAQLQSKKND